MRNKEVNRNEGSVKIFEDRNVHSDYRTIVPYIRKGHRVLDVGCGTGAITAGIAALVADSGCVVGIDNTAKFIESGQQKYDAVKNMELVCTDLFDFYTKVPFDIIISARTFQWLSKPLEAANKLVSLLKPRGMLSILDYDHIEIEWYPKPPASMLMVYDGFLAWRKDSGLDNQIAKKLKSIYHQMGLDNIVEEPCPELYTKEHPLFEDKLKIWSKVAELPQIVSEGYITEDEKNQAIAEYNGWVECSAEQMIMKLVDVRGNMPDLKPGA